MPNTTALRAELVHSREALIEAAESRDVQGWLKADRRAQRAIGSRYGRVSRRKADEIWATLTDVQRAAANLVWRECS